MQKISVSSVATKEYGYHKSRKTSLYLSSPRFTVNLDLPHLKPLLICLEMFNSCFIITQDPLKKAELCPALLIGVQLAEQREVGSSSGKIA
jgi:hypothetical protein